MTAVLPIVRADPRFGSIATIVRGTARSCRWNFFE